MKKCLNCRRTLVRWRTKEGFKGLSGWKCPNGCHESHTIDQYPFDLQTQELRKMLSQKEDTRKFTEIDWVKLEEKEGYVIQNGKRRHQVLDKNWNYNRNSYYLNNIKMEKEITEAGKREVEKMLRGNKRIRKMVFTALWKKLEKDFYETEPKQFALKVLALEIMLKNSGINLGEELEK